jgi:hypothetical protein
MVSNLTKLQNQAYLWYHFKRRLDILTRLVFPHWLRLTSRIWWNGCLSCRHCTRSLSFPNDNRCNIYGPNDDGKDDIKFRTRARIPCQPETKATIDHSQSNCDPTDPKMAIRRSSTRLLLLKRQVVCKSEKRLNP